MENSFGEYLFTDGGLPLDLELSQNLHRAICSSFSTVWHFCGKLVSEISLLTSLCCKFERLSCMLFFDGPFFEEVRISQLTEHRRGFSTFPNRPFF
jgi:hypothetical protein